MSAPEKSFYDVLSQQATFCLASVSQPHATWRFITEKPLLEAALRDAGGNQVQAARILGINRNTLRKRIKEYRIGAAAAGGEVVP